MTTLAVLPLRVLWAGLCCINCSEDESLAAHSFLEAAEAVVWRLEALCARCMVQRLQQLLAVTLLAFQYAPLSISSLGHISELAT